jgi:hypothetical protein
LAEALRGRAEYVRLLGREERERQGRGERAADRHAAQQGGRVAERRQKGDERQGGARAHAHAHTPIDN